jgi:hypothetical protein
VSKDLDERDRAWMDVLARYSRRLLELDIQASAKALEKYQAMKKACERNG